MRIGMIFHSLNVPGGSASVFLSLALALQEQGHNVHVFCYYFDPEYCFPELNKKLKIHCIKKIDSRSHRINTNSIWIRLLLGYEYYFNARKIYRLLKKFKFDLLYAAEASAYIPALIYKKKKSVRVYWSVFDPISLVDNKRPGLMTHKYRWFATLLKIHNLFDTRNIRKIDRVIVPTKKMKKQLDLFYGISASVFPTAGVRVQESRKKHISLIERRLQERFNFRKEDENILFSNGHLLPHRRYEDVLHALRSLVKIGYRCKYIISGSNKFDPNYFVYLQALVKKLHLDDYVILDTDFKSNEEILGYYQYCDIFLFVSVEQTWGLAPFEAMLCKKPVIISKGVGCSEVLTDKKDALIVQERSPEQIAECIEHLVKNKLLYKKVSEGGYERTLVDFTYQNIAAKLINMMNASGN
ncbi:MAG: glycosyltransferase family 4 protein [Candidatus Levybacteria bacterium]|nr:glycosyltransferase family 4 protein [Candidatus Levybacteria bacterium]